MLGEVWNSELGCGGRYWKVLGKAKGNVLRSGPSGEVLGEGWGSVGRGVGKCVRVGEK